MTKYLSKSQEFRAEVLEGAASTLLSEEVEYSQGLDGDHLFNFTHVGSAPAYDAEGNALLDSHGNSVLVDLPAIPEEVGEMRLALATARHRAEASVLLVMARDIRGTNCAEGPLLWRDEDMAMADPRLPNECVREAGHDGPHSGRTEEQVEEVRIYCDLARLARQHGVTLPEVTA